MADKTDHLNKIYLMLQSNGYIALDRDAFLDGCESPPLEPSIAMTPVSIRRLSEQTRERFLDNPDADFPKKLKILLSELRTSANLIEKTISEIEQKLD